MAGKNLSFGVVMAIIDERKSIMPTHIRQLKIFTMNIGDFGR